MAPGSPAETDDGLEPEDGGLGEFLLSLGRPVFLPCWAVIQPEEIVGVLELEMCWCGSLKP